VRISTPGTEEGVASELSGIIRNRVEFHSLTP
jgi:hypothetical protein